MPLSQQTTRATGTIAPVRRRRAAARVLLLTVLLIATATALAGGQKDEMDQDNLPHNLGHVSMCVDGDSIALHLDSLATDRRQGVIDSVLPGVTQSLATLPRRLGGAAATQRASCVGSASYLVVDIRVVSLDPAVYTRYGQRPYSIAIWVQVGTYETPEQRSGDDPSLGNLTFEGFDENVFDEAAPGNGMMRTVLGHSQQLLANLTSAYRADNP